MMTTCSIGLGVATSDALTGRVGPLELDRVRAELLRLPRADVADLTVGVVVVALSRHGICDGFAKLMRAGGGERVEDAQAAGAAAAVRVRHHRVEERPADVT